MCAKIARETAACAGEPLGFTNCAPFLAMCLFAGKCCEVLQVHEEKSVRSAYFTFERALKNFFNRCKWRPSIHEVARYWKAPPGMYLVIIARPSRGSTLFLRGEPKKYELNVLLATTHDALIHAARLSSVDIRTAKGRERNYERLLEAGFY